MPSWSAEIQAQINVAQTYQYETYTFLRYCEHYIVGYSTHGVQILKGKCHYGGIRDLGVNIGGHYPVDLPAWIGGVVYANLPAEIIGERATQKVNLVGIIGGHLPKDLGAIIDTHYPEDLSAYIRGFAYRDLLAHITAIYEQDLPAEIYGIPPRDLSAYLKVWPQEDLPAFIHGWQLADLSAYINTIASVDLPAIIGGHSPGNIRAWIKGWVREATYDLGAYIFGYAKDNLGAIIRGTFMEQLPAYLFPVQPVDLSAYIYGWQLADLQGIINGTAYPWDLPASIFVSGSFTSLPAEIYGREFTATPRDLSAYILITQGRDNLPAALTVRQAKDLSAFIDTGNDIANLPASIYPKRIRLTGVLSVITMEHRDLSATISIPCFYSELKDLSAYIRPVYQSNLSATLNAKGYVFAQGNLGASFGYAVNTVVQDKLTINISIPSLGFRTEDKYNINISIFRSGLSLGASIVSQRDPVDLPAYINGLNILPYDFETWKGKERVYDTSYTQVLRDYEDVDISFQTIVKDYFYSSGSDVVAKVDKYTHFVTKVASYYSPATSRRLDRKLHKVKYLYDMSHFDTVDEAMRYAIWYVTAHPKSNLSAQINSIAPMGAEDLTARIGAKRYFSDINNLTSNIDGKLTHDYDIIIGYEDDGVDFLQF